MDFRVVVLFIMVGIFLAFSLIIYFKGQRRLSVKVFNIFVISLALWAFGLAMFYISTDLKIALFWMDVLYLAGSLIPAAFLLFSFVFPFEKFTISRINQVLIFVPNMILFVLFFFTPIIVKQIAIVNGIKRVIYGQGHILWDIQFDIIFVWSFVRFIKMYRRHTGIIKNRLKYIILGTFIGVILAGITNVIMPWFNRFELIWLGPLFTLTWLGSVSYAIVKYRLMDITLFARDTTVFLVYVGITLLIFVPLIILPIVFFGKSVLWLSALFVILLVFVSPPLHHSLIYSSQNSFPQKLINWIDRKLFRGKFLYLNGLTEFWEKTGVVYTSSQLAWTLVPAIAKMMDLTSCSFLLFERNKKEFVFKAQIGLDAVLGNDETLPNKTVSVHSALIRYLSEKKQVAVGEELEKSNDQQTKEAGLALKEIGSYLAAPIFVANRLTAVLNLGSKKNKDMFSGKDLKIVKELVEKTKNHLSHTVFLENSIFFSGALAHDIRSMFKSGIIYEYLGEIRDGLEKESEKNIACAAIDDLGQRIETIQKMSELMVDIYASLERFVTGKYNPQRINYSELTANVAKGFLALAREKGIELEVLLPAAPFFIYAEPLDVERILTELLTNAVKYTQQGKISIEVYQENPNEVLTKITDTGKGIARENLEDIFEPFTRIKNGINTDGKGIGLTCVRQLLDVNAGRIWVKNRLNEGSSFFFVLPCAKKEKGGG